MSGNLLHYTSMLRDNFGSFYFVISCLTLFVCNLMFSNVCKSVEDIIIRDFQKEQKSLAKEKDHQKNNVVHNYSYLSDITAKGVFQILRPWSLTATFIPCSIASLLVYFYSNKYYSGNINNENINNEGFYLQFFRFFSLVILSPLAVQLIANVANSLYDVKNGCDKFSDSAFSTMRLEKRVYCSPLWCTRIILLITLIGLLAHGHVIQILVSKLDNEIGVEIIVLMTIAIFFFGFLSLSYIYIPGNIMKPLKYIAMGDTLIFISFGPLIMMYTTVTLLLYCNPSLMNYEINMNINSLESDVFLINKNTWINLQYPIYFQVWKYLSQHSAVLLEVFLHSIPHGLYITAILVGNNNADFINDQVAGIRTVSILLGNNGCRLYHAALISVSHLFLISIYILTNKWISTIISSLSLLSSVKLLSYIMKTSYPVKHKGNVIWVSPRDTPSRTGFSQMMFGLSSLLAIIVSI